MQQDKQIIGITGRAGTGGLVRLGGGGTDSSIGVGWAGVGCLCEWDNRSATHAAGEPVGYTPRRCRTAGCCGRNAVLDDPIAHSCCSCR